MENDDLRQESVEVQDEVKESQEAKTEEKTEKKSKIKEKFDKFNDTEDNSHLYEQKDIEENKSMAILCYISWLVLVPLFTKKESKYTRFHVNQGLVLAIVCSAYWVLEGILSAVLTLAVPALYWLWGFIFSLPNILLVFLVVKGIINAAKGQAKKLPLIGKFKILKDVE